MEKEKTPANVSIRRIEWLDEAFRAAGQAIYRKPIGPKGSRKLTHMLRSAMLLWAASPDNIKRASLEAIEYGLDDPEEAMRIITAALSSAALAQVCNQIEQTPSEVAARLEQSIHRRSAGDKSARAAAKSHKKGKVR